MRELWLKALGELEKKIPQPDIFRTWIDVLQLDEQASDATSGVLVLEAPTTKHIQFLQVHHYDQIIKETISKLSTEALHVSLVSKKKITPVYNEETFTEKASVVNIDKLALNCGLHEGLRFDTFVTGKANQVARSSAEIVSQNPGRTYNPFFIYGGVGLGKTHLMHSVGRKILEDNPSCKLLCISAERFIQEVVNLSAGGRLADENVRRFDEKYRTLDVLMIDDVQFLSKKGGTQQRLFGILKLYSQVISKLF